MTLRDVSDIKPQEFNRVVNHIIQSFEWGEFRQKTGVRVRRIGVFEENVLRKAYQITFHSLPFGKLTIGYLPKSDIPIPSVCQYLKEIGQEENAIFIKLEPEVEKGKIKDKNGQNFLKQKEIVKSPKTIFAPHTFILDLKKSEEELLSKMHPKTRYNIRLAQKHGVKVEEKSDQKSFNLFLKLQRETARRQKFFIHPDSYYQKMWATLRPKKMVHLLLASYKNEPLCAWILFRFGNILYYPYGGSSQIHKNLMASNLIAWEAIRLGKKLGAKTFDFWGALGENPAPSDPWYGFHRFKAGYGGKLVSYIGAYDLVIKPIFYQTFILADKIRWFLLRTSRTFGDQ